MPATMHPRVDLPQPDSPTRPTTSPSPTLMSTESTTTATSSCTFAPRRPATLAGTVKELDEMLGELAQLEELGGAHGRSPRRGWKQRTRRPGPGWLVSGSRTQTSVTRG